MPHSTVILYLKSNKDPIDSIKQTCSEYILLTVDEKKLQEMKDD